MVNQNSNQQEILEATRLLINRSLREVISGNNAVDIDSKLKKYGTKRKGYFGDILEEFGYNIPNNNIAQADFPEAQIELKSTPLIRNKSGKYRAKERLVFSMINYMRIIDEEWDTCSFLSKNQKILIVFYLYDATQSILDYKISHFKFIDLLNGISQADVFQIMNDWQSIVDKVKAGQAHLLSEGDTAYLGAATKARNKLDTRPQPYSEIPAKKRAFSLKQSYLNSMVEELTASHDANKTESIFKTDSLPQTIENYFDKQLSTFIGKTEEEIAAKLGMELGDKKPKNLRRLLVNRILGVNGNKIKELIKANTTMKVIKLEPSGNLVESLPFPNFKYTEIINQTWEESELYKALTEKRYVFVIFRKDGNTSRLELCKFWNFPMKDIEEAERVWKITVSQIKDCKSHILPKISESYAIHVRPHAQNKADTYPTPCGGNEVKKCFWLNAKYIEKQLKI